MQQTNGLLGMNCCFNHCHLSCGCMQTIGHECHTTAKIATAAATATETVNFVAIASLNAAQTIVTCEVFKQCYWHIVFRFFCDERQNADMKCIYDLMNSTFPLKFIRCIAVSQLIVDRPTEHTHKQTNKTAQRKEHEFWKGTKSNGDDEHKSSQPNWGILMGPLSWWFRIVAHRSFLYIKVDECICISVHFQFERFEAYYFFFHWEYQIAADCVRYFLFRNKTCPICFLGVFFSVVGVEFNTNA